jgi:hypothetical protein
VKEEVAMCYTKGKSSTEVEEENTEKRYPDKNK